MYMGGIIVTNKDDPEHKDHLYHFIHYLEDRGIVINVAKCQFGVSIIDSLI